MIDTQTITSNLQVFADPATPFTAVAHDDVIVVGMIREGQARRLEVSVPSGEILARHSGSRFVSIAAMLASAEFSNIRLLKDTQRRLLSLRHPQEFIEPEGVIHDHTGGESSLTLPRAREALAGRSGPDLHILLLDGPAGVGKTSLIERMVYERAAPTEGAPPILHVTSGGGRLTDLSKALAHTLQQLRSGITFDQVPVLARFGVIQVAIDGFDELVDPHGYKDAWSALRQFLSDVGSGGPVVLSGRDTFFDQQSFESVLLKRVPNLALSHARLKPISPGSAKQFLRQHGWTEAEVNAAERDGWLQKGSYRLRPFFLSQIGKAGGWTELASLHESPQAFLVSRFVAREAALVTEMVEVSPGNAESALYEFFGLIAEDMASQEVDTVDEGYITLACEAAFHSLVSSIDLQKLARKAASFALLEPADQSGLRRFPHSEIQDQFVARVIASRIATSSAVSSFLRRGLVTSTISAAFAEYISDCPSTEALRLRERLENILRDGLASDRLSSNIATLLIAFLSRDDGAGISLDSLILADPRIVGIAAPAVFRNVSFAQLDVRGADCSDIEFSACDVITLLADELTRFGETPPRVRVLQIEDSGELRTMREPRAIQEWLVQHSRLDRSMQDQDLPLVRFFDRVCRKFARQHQIRDHETDTAAALVRHPYWPDVAHALGSRLQKESRSTQGPRSSFYRIVRPEALLAPDASDEESLAIRSRVVDRARQLSN